MPKPFRFAVQISTLPADGWIERVRAYERLGYSTVFCPDHFGPQWDPTALLAAAAAVTTRLRVGSLVYDVDYRHPVIHAKGAATIQLLSGGRHEFGIGAGWMQTDYDEAGMTYDSPGHAHRAARRGAADHQEHVGERAHHVRRQALPESRTSRAPWSCRTARARRS